MIQGDPNQRISNMNTATATFSRAIHVCRSDTGCYAFAGRDQFFADAIGYRFIPFDWQIVEPLTGWGDWTHAVRVMLGNEAVYYFVR